MTHLCKKTFVYRTSLWNRFYRAMRKRDLCCRPVSVRLSVFPSVTLVHCIHAHNWRYRQTSLSTRGSPIILRDIRLVTIQWPWKPGLLTGRSRSSGSTRRSATYDFLLTFRSNHGPISYTASETNGAFSRKTQKFPIPVYFASPLKGFLLELGIGG